MKDRALLTEIEWISVKDRLPDAGHIVMVVAKFPEEGADIVNYCLRTESSGWQSYDFFGGYWYSLENLCTVTHWAEMITLPKGIQD